MSKFRLKLNKMTLMYSLVFEPEAYFFDKLEYLCTYRLHIYTYFHPYVNISDDFKAKRYFLKVIYINNCLLTITRNVMGMKIVTNIILKAILSVSI